MGLCRHPSWRERASRTGLGAWEGRDQTPLSPEGRHGLRVLQTGPGRLCKAHVGSLKTFLSLSSFFFFLNRRSAESPKSHLPEAPEISGVKQPKSRSGRSFPRTPWASGLQPLPGPQPPVCLPVCWDIRPCGPLTPPPESHTWSHLSTATPAPSAHPHMARRTAAGPGRNSVDPDNKLSDPGTDLFTDTSCRLSGLHTAATRRHLGPGARLRLRSHVMVARRTHGAGEGGLGVAPRSPDALPGHHRPLAPEGRAVRGSGQPRVGVSELQDGTLLLDRLFQAAPRSPGPSRWSVLPISTMAGVGVRPRVPRAQGPLVH